MDKKFILDLIFFFTLLTVHLPYFNVYIFDPRPRDVINKFWKQKDAEWFARKMFFSKYFTPKRDFSKESIIYIAQ